MKKYEIMLTGSDWDGENVIDMTTKVNADELPALEKWMRNFIIDHAYVDFTIRIEDLETGVHYARNVEWCNAGSYVRDMEQYLTAFPNVEDCER